MTFVFLYIGVENLGIIFEFSPWVLKICPEDGLKVRHTCGDFIFMSRSCRPHVSKILLFSDLHRGPDGGGDFTQR